MLQVRTEAEAEPAVRAWLVQYARNLKQAVARANQAIARFNQQQANP